MFKFSLRTLIFVGMVVASGLPSGNANAAITDFKNFYLTTHPTTVPDLYSIQAYCPSSRPVGGWEICRQLGMAKVSDMIRYLESAGIDRADFQETLSQMSMSQNLTLVTLIAVPVAMLFDLRTASLQEKISCKHHPFEIVLHDLELKAQRGSGQDREATIYLPNLTPILEGLAVSLSHLDRGQLEADPNRNRCAD